MPAHAVAPSSVFPIAMANRCSVDFCATRTATLQATRCPAPASRALRQGRQPTTTAALFRSLPSLTFGGARKKRAIEALKSRLLEAAEGTCYGAKCSTARRQQVDELAAELARSGGDRAPTARSLDGAWKLLYTTEKSVHAIANGLLLGLPVTEIQQTVDLSEPRVTNCVSLALGCQLQASGPAVIAGPQRVEYAFDAATLQLPFGLQLSFRPRGGGWTDAVYCDGAMRVMRNSQGDTLVFIKDL